jgi:hypothetical protein
MEVKNFEDLIDYLTRNAMKGSKYTPSNHPKNPRSSI